MLWTASCTCFFGFLRSGEAAVPSHTAYDPTVHLSINDFQLNSASDPSVIIVNIKASKTDTFRRGVSIYLGRTGMDLCPVRALLAYVARRGFSSGPLFVLEDGRFMTRADLLVQEVRETLHQRGMDASVFAATSAAVVGIEDAVIKTLGRWKSTAYLQYVQLPRETLADIQELPREDTICQFCGVSYLVHHEVKRLEERVIYYQQEVKRLLLAETTLSTLDETYKELEMKYYAKCDELKSARQERIETTDQLHTLLTSVELVQVDRKEVLHLLSNMLSSIKDSRSVLMNAVSTYVCRDCGRHAEEIGKLQLNLAEREQFYQNQCRQQEEVHAVLRGSVDRWEKEAFSYKSRLNGMEGKLVEAEAQVQRYRAEMDSLTEKLRRMKSNLMNLEETVTKKNTAMQSLESIYSENEVQLSATKAKLRRVEIARQSEKESFEASYENFHKDLASVRGELKAMETKHHLQMKKQQKEYDAALKKCEMESLLVKEELKKTQKQLQVQASKMKSTLAAADLEHQRSVQNLQEELAKEKSIFEREMCKHITQVKELQLKLVSEQGMKKETAKMAKSLDECKELLKGKEAHCQYLKKLLDEAYKEITLLQITVQKQCEEREELKETMTKAQT